MTGKLKLKRQSTVWRREGTVCTFSLAYSSWEGKTNFRGTKCELQISEDFRQVMWWTGLADAVIFRENLAPAPMWVLWQATANEWFWSEYYHAPGESAWKEANLGKTGLFEPRTQNAKWLHFRTPSVILPQWLAERQPQEIAMVKVQAGKRSLDGFEL